MLDSKLERRNYICKNAAPQARAFQIFIRAQIELKCSAGEAVKILPIDLSQMTVGTVSRDLKSKRNVTFEL